MQLSAWFPTRDIGGDPAKIRDWAQACEDLRFPVALGLEGGKCLGLAGYALSSLLLKLGPCLPERVHVHRQRLVPLP